METKGELAKAVIAVMKAVKGIEKSMTVGSGSMSYKGVPDQEVKKIIGEAMEKHGLCILPIGIDAKTKVDRWEETTVYNGQQQVKQKQSVFTEVTTKYLLLHTSGESQVLEGYGQGVDSQDKSAGKATTYALKYTLLYSFLVPTGKIDDADNTHSEDVPVPATKVSAITPEPVKHPDLIPGTERWLKVKTALVAEPPLATIEVVKSKNTLSAANEKLLLKEVSIEKQEIANKTL